MNQTLRKRFIPVTRDNAWTFYLSKLKLSGCFVIDKDIARAYNSKNLCLLISQILTDNVGR